MDSHLPDPTPNPSSSTPSRRDFLQHAAGIAAGVAATASEVLAEGPAQESATLLPTVALGPHRITRLIIGGNPIYGYSHFNKHFDRHLVDWHTPDRVVGLLRYSERNGINTWQNSYAERTISDLDRYRGAGGTMNWLCLGKPDWVQHPEIVNEAAKRLPIGIAPHGRMGEDLHRAKKYGVLTDFVKRIRDTGVLVGLSAHDPTLIDVAEEKGWDIDYYMCCLYYLSRPKDEQKKLLGGELPLGEIYLPSDPPRMFQRIQGTKKPCLVYKILAAGRRVGSPGEVRRCFETAFAQIKPTDAVIVGMYQQFSDQVGQNAALVRELASAR